VNMALIHPGKCWLKDTNLHTQSVPMFLYTVKPV
jgi:hypothetical protein